MRGVEYMEHLQVIPIHIKRRERACATTGVSALGVAGKPHCIAIFIVIIIALGALATAMSVALGGVGNTFRTNANKHA